ncbi:MAG: hypothetical protein K2J17_03925 [Paramuribaculum sp.]|nr:hypothetical protein [Paramuribaculum sp.]
MREIQTSAFFSLPKISITLPTIISSDRRRIQAISPRRQCVDPAMVQGCQSMPDII